MAIREIKEIQIGKEVKLPLFAGNMILYIKDSKDAIRKWLELINEFGKVAGYKFNTHKSVAFLYTNNERSEREIKKAIPFTISSKRIKHLGITLPKKTKDLKSKNYKTLMKKLKMTQTDGKLYHVLGLEKSILSNDYIIQSNIEIQCDSCQIANGILSRTTTTKLIPRNLLHSNTQAMKDQKEKLRKQSQLPLYQKE